MGRAGVRGSLEEGLVGAGVAWDGGLGDLALEAVCRTCLGLKGATARGPRRTGKEVEKSAEEVAASAWLMGELPVTFTRALSMPSP